MSQQRKCHWVCYLIIHICCVWGHIWNRHRCSQLYPREALTPCGCDSATFLNYLIVAGDFKIEILSAAFYPKWWKASKKHYWDILLLALWHWAFITINKLWYLSVVFWGISYKATGRLISITYVYLSLLKNNGTHHVGWVSGGLSSQLLSAWLRCLGMGVTGLLSSHWVNRAWHQASPQFKGGITAKALKIWAQVEGRVPRKVKNAPMGHHPSLKKCKEETWEEAPSALGYGAAGWGICCSLESNIPTRMGQHVAQGGGLGLGLASKPYKGTEFGGGEEKADARFRSGFPHGWAAGSDHLHCSDWGHEGPWPPVLVTQVSSVVLGTHSQAWSLSRDGFECAVAVTEGE